MTVENFPLPINFEEFDTFFKQQERLISDYAGAEGAFRHLNVDYIWAIAKEILAPYNNLSVRENRPSP